MITPAQRQKNREAHLRRKELKKLAAEKRLLKKAEADMDALSAAAAELNKPEADIPVETEPEKTGTEFAVSLVDTPDPTFFHGYLTTPEPVKFSPNPSYTTPAADLFTTWFNSSEGRTVADPRMSRDGVRFGIELDDKIRAAFIAGVERGRA